MKIKRILCVILAMTVLLCGGVVTSVSADTTTISANTTSKVMWNYNKNSKTLYIYGTGDMGSLQDSNNKYNYPWKQYRDEITAINIAEGITTISDNAFFNCEKVISVTIPNTVTSIGRSFVFCSSLTSIDIPASVTSIHYRTFGFCGKLESINVDKNNKYFTSVDGVLYNKNKTKLVRYPEGKRDESLVIPSTVKVINKDAFYSCDYIKNVTIPNSVTTMEYNAFFHCDELVNVKMGNSVVTMDSFSCCNKLKSLYIPKTCKKIDTPFAYSNSNITGITVHKDNKYFSSSKGVLYNKDKTILYKYTSGSKNTSFEIPNTVKEVYTSAFSNSKNLQSIKIPNTVETLGNCAFEGCSKLKSVRVPNKVTWLSRTFLDCYNLESISLPSSLYEFESCDIKGCDNLKEIVFRGRKSQWNAMEGIDKLEKPKNCTVRFELKENQFTVTKELSNIGISNKSNIVTKGKSFSAKLTPYKGYVLTEVTVKMNGRDVKVPFNNKSCNIKISKVNGDITIFAKSKKSQTISVKKSFTKKKGCKPFYLKAKAKTKLTYSSSNKKVATVNSKGKVTVKRVGKTTITIKAISSSTYVSDTKRIAVTVKKK